MPVEVYLNEPNLSAEQIREGMLIKKGDRVARVVNAHSKTMNIYVFRENAFIKDVDYDCWKEFIGEVIVRYKE